MHVLVVDDSAVVREVMSAVLSQESGITVAVAADPFIAMTKIKQQRPDVIILDLEMPRMDGLTFLKKIVREDPIPVVICSALTGPGTAVGLEALEEGAVEVVTKPRLAVKQFLHESAVILIDAVRAAANSRAIPRRINDRPPTPRFTADVVLPFSAKPVRHAHTETVVAIGASTGGTEALRIILRAMPFAQRLNQACAIEVKEAANGDLLTTGLALIAPGNRHALLRRNGPRYTVEVIDGALVSRHRPSVDVLFRSVAQSAGANAIGVILTGMGNDGADGMLEMKNAGAFTIAQDESSCVVFGMPKEAIARDAVDKIVGLSRIPHEILSADLQKPRLQSGRR